MEVTPAGKSVRPRRGRGRKCTRSEPRRGNFAQEYERLVDELLDTLSDQELDGGASGAQVLFRAKQKLRFPIAGGEAA